MSYTAPRCTRHTKHAARTYPTNVKATPARRWRWWCRASLAQHHTSSLGHVNMGGGGLVVGSEAARRRRRKQGRNEKSFEGRFTMERRHVCQAAERRRVAVAHTRSESSTPKPTGAHRRGWSPPPEHALSPAGQSVAGAKKKRNGAEQHICIGIIQTRGHRWPMDSPNPMEP